MAIRVCCRYSCEGIARRLLLRKCCVRKIGPHSEISGLRLLARQKFFRYHSRRRKKRVGKSAQTPQSYWRSISRASSLVDCGTAKECQKQTAEYFPNNSHYDSRSVLLSHMRTDDLRAPSMNQEVMAHLHVLLFSIVRTGGSVE